MAISQSQLDQYGIKLITQKDAPGRIFAYAPSNNAIGLGGPDQVHEILDPQSVQGYSLTDLDSLPKQQTGNVQQNFLYGKAGGANMNWADFESNVLGNYIKNSSIKSAQDLALANSNANLGDHAFTGKPSDYVVPQKTGGSNQPAPGSTYQIKNGDNLTNIAKAFGTTVEALMEANKDNPAVKSKDLILAGKTLNLPNFTPIIPTNSNSGIVTTDGIRSGETQKTTQTQKDQNDQTIKDQQTIKTLTDQKTISDLKASLGIPTSAPVLPSYKTTYEALRSSNGMQALETQMTSIDKQIADANLALKKGIYDEEGKLKSMSAMSASEKRMQDAANLTLQSLTAEKNVLIGEYNIRNGVINTMMTLTEKDYNAAENAYSDQFSKAVTLQNLLDSEDTKSRSEQNVVSDNARANLQIMINTIGDSGKAPDPSSLAQMEKLAMQAGWPSGILQQVLASGINKIDYTSTGYDANGNQVVSFFSKAGGGKLIKSITTPGIKGNSAPSPTELKTAMRGKLNAVAGQDGKVSPDDYIAKKKEWVSQNMGSAADFDNNFDDYADTRHYGDYKITY